MRSFQSDDNPYQFIINERFNPASTLLQNIPFNCQDVLKGHKSLSSSNWKLDTRKIEDELLYSMNKCEAVKKLLPFPNRILSKTEEEFPLAYGILAYKNIVQVLMMLSAFYQPQNVYCFAVGQNSDILFQNLLEDISNCWPNVYFMKRPPIHWGSFEIINSVFGCLEFLTHLKHDWKYFQYLSNFDLPLKTNLEMVHILTALNETANFELSQFQEARLNGKKMKNAPLPLYKSSLSALIPRKAAKYFSASGKAEELLTFLNNTKIADEGFWASLFANQRLFNAPGSIDGDEWMKRQKVLTKNWKNANKPSHSYYISRHQEWEVSNCHGIISSSSCAFGIGDLPTLLKSKKLVAHKFYFSNEPAAYVCLLKEIQQRTVSPDPLFNVSFYQHLPQVELKKGIKFENLTYPDFIL